MPLTVSDHAALLSAFAHGHDVRCDAYVLPAEIAQALEAAATSGAHVRVRLEGTPLGVSDSPLARHNAHEVAELRAHGVDARLVRDADGAPSVHGKLAIVDGVAWLDDRNYPAHAPDIVLRDDDAADVTAVNAALTGGATPASRIACDKRTALEAEQALVVGAVDTLDVSTESFGYCGVEKALREAAERGVHVRLIVATRELRHPGAQELHALAHLQGAEIRVRVDVDKLAVTQAQAWVGSADASTTHDAFGTQTDWGVVTHRPAAVDELRARFEQAWLGAKPYLPAPAQER